MDEAFLRVFQQETTDDEDEINLNDCWTNKYRYISFLLMFSCGAMQFEVYEELERFLNGGAFIFIYSMSTIILAMPVVYTEMFLGQYTKFSFTQIWRVAPIFFGYGFSVILMNSFYLLITAMNVAQTLIYWVLSLSKSENLYQCHDTYESDSKSIDALCYNVKLSVPLSYHSCSYLEPLHIRCSETDKPVQYPALNFYWEFFWDPQLNTDLFSTYFMVALIFVWIITCAILILGLSILNRLVTVSLFLVVIIKIGMLFVVNVSKFQLTEAELMNKFKIDLGKLLSLRIMPAIWFGIWRMGICIPNVYMTSTAYTRFSDRNVSQDTIVVTIISFCLTLIELINKSNTQAIVSNIYLQESDCFFTPGRGSYYALAPEYLRHSTIPTLFTVIYFTAMGIFELTQHICIVHIQLLNIFDFTPRLKTFKRYITVPFCVLMLLIGLIFCPKSTAITFFPALLQACTGYGFISIFLMELVLVYGFYGSEELTNDILFMTGYKPAIFWKFLWRLGLLISGGLYVIMQLFNIDFNYQTTFEDSYFKTEKTSSDLSTLFLIPIFIFWIVGAIYQFIIANRMNCYSRLIKPDFLWGPPAKSLRQARKAFCPRDEVRIGRHHLDKMDVEADENEETFEEREVVASSHSVVEEEQETNLFIWQDVKDDDDKDEEGTFVRKNVDAGSIQNPSI